MSAMSEDHKLLYPVLVHWDHAEILDRAGPRPRDIRRLFDQYGLPMPSYRMLSAWRARNKIPADRIPALLMILVEKGKLAHLHEVIVREDEEADVPLPPLPRAPRSALVSGRRRIESPEAR